MGEVGKGTKKTEITYQVGWKKGKIKFAGPLPQAVLSVKDSILFKYIWRPAGFLPASIQIVLLCIMPILVLAFIIKLVDMLMHY